MPRDSLALLVRAWLVTAVVDGLFASALSVFAYGTSAAALWRGVASTLLGPAALDGGTRAMLIGLLIHAGVALGWCAVFLGLVLTWPWLRRVVRTPGGIVGVAAVYGPLIWMVMSFAVIPLLTGRPPSVTTRWWVQLFAHVPFVALPIVATIGRGSDGSSWPGDVAPSRGAR